MYSFSSLSINLAIQPKYKPRPVKVYLHMSTKAYKEIGIHGNRRRLNKIGFSQVLNRQFHLFESVTTSTICLRDDFLYAPDVVNVNAQ